jgi:hypothetical protein
MWEKNRVNCLTKGHIFRDITYERTLYKYCLRCGKLIWEHRHLECACHNSTRTESSLVSPVVE